MIVNLYANLEILNMINISILSFLFLSLSPHPSPSRNLSHFHPHFLFSLSFSFSLSLSLSRSPSLSLSLTLLLSLSLSLSYSLSLSLLLSLSLSLSLSLYLSLSISGSIFLIVPEDQLSNTGVLVLDDGTYVRVWRNEDVMYPIPKYTYWDLDNSPYVIRDKSDAQRRVDSPMIINRMANVDRKQRSCLHIGFLSDLSLITYGLLSKSQYVYFEMLYNILHSNANFISDNYLSKHGNFLFIIQS